MELKVGMYCFCKQRRNLGIGKILNISIFGNIFVQFKNDVEAFVSSNLEASENIIDLIKENDLLSIEYYSPRYEERVTRLFEVDYRHDEYLSLKNAYCDFMLVNNEFREIDRNLNPIIKDIVTKEQFESIKYEVE